MIHLLSITSFFNIDGDFFTRLDLIKNNYILSNTDTFINYSSALSGIFALLYLSYKGWEMLIGDRDWEVLPLLRPFVLGFIIINFTSFVSLLNAPFKGLNNIAIGKFIKARQYTEKLLNKRDLNQQLLAAKIYAESDKIEKFQQDSTEKESKWYDIFDIFSSVGNKIGALSMVVMTKFQTFVNNIIVSIGEMFFIGSIALILVLQIIFQYILVVIGPISFAFSILEPFRQSYLEWIRNFISFSFYTVIALTVARMSFNLINYSLKLENTQLEKIFADKTDGAFMTYMATFTGVSSGGFIIFLFVGAFCTLLTPFLSNWILKSSGASSATGKLTMAAQAVTKI
ncbi:MAG: hypothetical protein KGV44_08950 [Flavobacteriaceae bacterium]|nr:hypothetical protein [Flavobacteriaceae bacterium]